MKCNFLFLCMLFFSSMSFSQTIYNYGDGYDLSHTIASGTTEFADDVRNKVLSINTGVQDEVVIGGSNLSSYATGDYVLVIDMCPSGCNGSTTPLVHYNIRVVRGLSTDGLYITPLSLFTANGSCLQVIKLKRYINLTLNGTLTCHAYDPAIGTGGVVCVLVNGTLSVGTNGKIDASETILGPDGGIGGGASLTAGSGGAAGGGDASPTNLGYPRSYGNPGYCFEVSGAESCNYKGCGEEGGTGTYPKMGDPGGSSNPPTISCVFATGSSGAGGRGPGAGGNGGGGGSSVGGNETAGTAGGQATGTGGNGGDGGDGGGLIYLRAAAISVPVSHVWMISNGGPGGPGGDAGDGGDGGNGGNGADAGCIAPSTWKDAGGYGGIGIGGNGGAGGNGGKGGDGGPILLYTITHIANLSNYTQQNGGLGGAAGNGGDAGTNGTPGTNGAKLSTVQTCCPYSGGTEGGGSDPTETPSLTPQTREYFCECWKIFRVLGEEYISRTGPVNDIYTYVLSASAPIGSQSLTVNTTTGELVLTVNSTATDGNYSGPLTEIYHCQVNPGNLTQFTNFVGDFVARSVIVNNPTGSPRSLDFGASNNYWKYIELNPDYRYLEKSNTESTRAYMESCFFFETSNGSPLPGWAGQPGSGGSGKQPNQINEEPSTSFDETLMMPREIKDKNKYGNAKETPGFNVLIPAEDNTAGEPEMKIQPNPASRQLQVQYSNIPAGTYTLRATDALGRTVYEKTINAIESSGQQIINVSLWQPGGYILRLSSKQVNLEQRAIIRR